MTCRVVIGALQIRPRLFRWRESPPLVTRYGYVDGVCPKRDEAPAFIANSDGWIWTGRVRRTRYAWVRLSLRDSTEYHHRLPPAELRGGRLRQWVGRVAPTSHGGSWCLPRAQVTFSSATRPRYSTSLPHTVFSRRLCPGLWPPTSSRRSLAAGRTRVLQHRATTTGSLTGSPATPRRCAASTPVCQIPRSSCTSHNTWPNA